MKQILKEHFSDVTIFPLVSLFDLNCLLAITFYAQQGGVWIQIIPCTFASTFKNSGSHASFTEPTNYLFQQKQL